MGFLCISGLYVIDRYIIPITNIHSAITAEVTNSFIHSLNYHRCLLSLNQVNSSTPLNIHPVPAYLLDVKLFCRTISVMHVQTPFINSLLISQLTAKRKELSRDVSIIIIAHFATSLSDSNSRDPRISNLHLKISSYSSAWQINRNCGTHLDTTVTPHSPPSSYVYIYYANTSLVLQLLSLCAAAAPMTFLSAYNYRICHTNRPSLIIIADPIQLSQNPVFSHQERPTRLHLNCLNNLSIHLLTGCLAEGLPLCLLCTYNSISRSHCDSTTWNQQNIVEGAINRKKKQKQQRYNFKIVSPHRPR